MGSNTTYFLLVRHGETDWNKEGRLQGQCADNPPLNELGQRQAAALADRIAEVEISAIYSSDLERAVQTARAIATKTGMQVNTTKELRERNLGILEGLKRSEAPTVEPEGWRCLVHPSTSTRVPGGESVDDLSSRVVQAVQDIAAKHPGERVVVVTHGGALSALYKRAMDHLAPFKMVNCAVNEVHVDGKLCAAVCWNDASHLEPVGYITTASGGGASGG